MPSKKAVQRLRRRIEQQKKLKNELRGADEELYLLVHRTIEDERVSSYGLAVSLGVSSRTVQRWYQNGKRIAEEPG